LPIPQLQFPAISRTAAGTHGRVSRHGVSGPECKFLREPGLLLRIRAAMQRERRSISLQTIAKSPVSWLNSPASPLNVNSKGSAWLMAHLLLLNGPNLNLLGTREPATYGAVTLEQIVARLGQLAAEAGHHLSAFQSNAEAELITRIHEAPTTHVAFIIFNPAAFTHTSIALRDALLGVKIPFIEVHLSNVHAREAFRHHSYFSDIAVGTITGLGAVGYELALRAAAHHLASARK
jgi:3-dehydroquinate dehydratase II